MNRQDEIRALGGVAGDVLEDLVRAVEDVHGAISARVDSALPPPAKPVHTIVRATTTATYATVRAAHRWLPRGAAAVAAARTQADGPSILDHPSALKAVATLNGILGPAVTDPAAVTTALTLFHRGERLALDALAKLPDVQPHVVLFLHGLVETEADWSRQPRGTLEPHIPYPEALEAEHGVTSLVARYNTGLAVGRSGAELAELIAHLESAWPVPLDGITLVGHSMGGLVARSAAHQAHLAGHAWVGRLRLIVSLGTPHLGSPVSKAVDIAERALNAFPETAPIGQVLARRSPGVRDLSHGRLVEDETAELDPPGVPGVAHCSLGSTLTKNPNHPVSMVIGDGLVRLPSAAGRGRKRRLDFDVDIHVGRMNHFTLLNDAAVYKLLREWMHQFALSPRQPTPAEA